MTEAMRVTLARIEERVEAIHDKMDDAKEKTDTLDKDVGSLKQSRSYARGIFMAIIVGLGFLGADAF